MNAKNIKEESRTVNDPAPLGMVGMLDKFRRFNCFCHETYLLFFVNMAHIMLPHHTEHHYYRYKD